MSTKVLEVFNLARALKSSPSPRHLDHVQDDLVSELPCNHQLLAALKAMRKPPHLPLMLHQLLTEVARAVPGAVDRASTLSGLRQECLPV